MKSSGADHDGGIIELDCMEGNNNGNHVSASMPVWHEHGGFGIFKLNSQKANTNLNIVAKRSQTQNIEQKTAKNSGVMNVSSSCCPGQDHLIL